MGFMVGCLLAVGDAVVEEELGLAGALGGGGVGEGGGVPTIGHLAEDGMGTDAAEPVTGVELVGFVAVEDGVPVAAGGGMEVLGDLVRLLPEAAAEPEAGADAGGQRGGGQEGPGGGPGVGQDGGDLVIGRHRYHYGLAFRQTGRGWPGER